MISWWLYIYCIIQHKKFSSSCSRYGHPIFSRLFNAFFQPIYLQGLLATVSKHVVLFWFYRLLSLFFICSLKKSFVTIFCYNYIDCIDISITGSSGRASRRRGTANPRRGEATAEGVGLPIEKGVENLLYCSIYKYPVIFSPRFCLLEYFVTFVTFFYVLSIFVLRYLNSRDAHFFCISMHVLTPERRYSSSNNFSIHLYTWLLGSIS